MTSLEVKSLRRGVLLASIGLCLALSACSGGGSGGGASLGSTAASPALPAATQAPTPTSAAVTSSGTAASGSAALLQPPAGLWLNGDFHVHSEHSGDATTLGDDITTVIACAQAAGLDFTVISDHRCSDCLTDPQFTGARTPLVLIPGEEWGQPGHAGIHGLTRAPVSDTQDETQGPAVAIQKIQAVVDDVHSMGGIFIINHPMDSSVPWLWPVDRFDGMEAWNQSWAFRSSDDMTPAMAQAWIASHGTQPVPEFFTALAVTGGGQNLQRLALYEAHLSSGRHIAAMGGGDSHYLFLPGQPTTRVFAAARTMPAILDAVRHSRTQVLRSPAAPDLEFTADRYGTGAFETILGDSIPLGLAPTFKVHVKGAQDGKFDIVRNGTVLRTVPVASNDFVFTFQDQPTVPTWYRVNLWEKLDVSTSDEQDLRTCVLGSQSVPWLSLLTSGPLGGLLGGQVATFAAQAQQLLDTGGPAAVWLIMHGGSLGVTQSSVGTRYPRYILPDNVSKIMNTAIQDQDYCASVLTSPIWVE
jgi:hypothetical protein